MREFLKEFWLYLKAEKKYWLLPIIVALLFLGVPIVTTEGSAIAPFIYALF